MKDYLKYAFSFLVFGVLLNSAIAQVDEIKPTFKFKKENADTSLFSKGLQNTWLLEKPF